MFKYSFLPPPPQPSPPPSPVSTPFPCYCPCVLYNGSCKPFTLFPYNPLPSPLWSLSACSQFQCLWLYFACLFVLLILIYRFVLMVSWLTVKDCPPIWPYQHQILLLQTHACNCLCSVLHQFCVFPGSICCFEGLHNDFLLSCMSTYAFRIYPHPSIPTSNFAHPKKLPNSSILSLFHLIQL